MKTLYTFRDRYDSQEVLVCDLHAKDMPQVNGDSVIAQPADEDCSCDFCRREPSVCSHLLADLTKGAA
jgi:hypothetical protein